MTDQAEKKESEKLMQEYANQCGVLGDMVLGINAMKANLGVAEQRLNDQMTKCNNIFVDVDKARRKEISEEKKNESHAEAKGTDDSKFVPDSGC